MRSKLILGSRGSKLALAQADITASRLKKVCSSLDIEIHKINTAGDRDQRASLSEIGGKGIFIKELEQALIEGTIDVAVHSFKDITSQMPKELELCAFFSPESICDVLISRNGLLLEQMPSGARIGTSSMRRKVLLSRKRADLCCVDIRGNIDTRISKMERGDYEGIILSEAGLIRLGMQKMISQRFDPKIFYPAPGQGVIALQGRKNDFDIKKICRAAGDEKQFNISIAEYTVLSSLGFDCTIAFGVYSCVHEEEISMKGFYVNPSTGNFFEQEVSGLQTDPERLGMVLSKKLLEGN